jgi:hypothetical protein
VTCDHHANQRRRCTTGCLSGFRQERIGSRRQWPRDALGSEAAAIRKHLFRLACERLLVLDEQERIVGSPVRSCSDGFLGDGVIDAVVGWLRVGRVRDTSSREDQPEVLVATQCPGAVHHAWTVNRHHPPEAIRSHTSWYRSNECGTTLCTRAHTNASSATTVASSLAEAHLECIGLRHGPGNPMAAGPIGTAAGSTDATDGATRPKPQATSVTLAYKVVSGACRSTDPQNPARSNSARRLGACW